MTDSVLHDHLAGKISVGLYSMLADDSCRLLACDFDGEQWRLDTQAHVQAADAAGVPTAVEVSRSGRGAHVWIFFTQPVPALDARALGFGLLREAMAMRGELGLDSYDRFFPSQDHLPDNGEGLGNLIALPLQKQCRDAGTTVFVDPDTFTPYPDQWTFLTGVAKLGLAELQQLVGELRPVAVGPDVSLFRSTLRPEAAPPAVVHAEWSGMLAVRRAGLPPSLLASLKHAASLANPAFYKNENLRLSNWNTPRYVRCYTEDLEFLYLPRAMVDKPTDLVARAGSRVEINDQRADPPPIDVTFTARLRDRQPGAVAELARHEHGVLEAPPGSGKTVMGCALIAHHKTPTLVLVDRAPLMDQWRDRLTTVLDIDPARVGQVGGGKTKPTGVIDLAMTQTVARMHDATTRLPGYGLVIVDEAHHAGAPTIEKALRRIPAGRWGRPYRHRLPPRRPRPGDLQQVCRDVHRALERGRNCLILTRRTTHVETLAQRLRDLGHEPQLLYATRKTKELKQVLSLLADPPADGPPLLVVATDKYVGEGYDGPRLDALFLAHPVSFKGSRVQNFGRILRTYPGKASVEVHDDIDSGVGVLAAMWRKRSRSYTQLGFTPIKEPGREL